MPKRAQASILVLSWGAEMAEELPHSVAHKRGDGRLSAPSAARNIAPILDAMSAYVPSGGVALEIASGTGEHIVEFARAFPNVVWQPTDIDPRRLVSIDAWRADWCIQNMRLALLLDASRPRWRTDPMAMIVTVNLMHLIPDAMAKSVIAGVARNLAPGAYWFLYGPFKSGGEFRSGGDRDFHASLVQQDAEMGYKDIEKVSAWAQSEGLKQVALLEMPANNLALVVRK